MAAIPRLESACRSRERPATPQRGAGPRATCEMLRESGARALNSCLPMALLLLLLLRASSCPRGEAWASDTGLNPKPPKSFFFLRCNAHGVSWR